MGVQDRALKLYPVLGSPVIMVFSWGLYLERNNERSLSMGTCSITKLQSKQKDPWEKLKFRVL